MASDPLRHLSVFTPHAFGERRVDVIGCGATGSTVVELLSDLGVMNIHAHDFDRVEEHNIANQIYRLGDVGRLKVEALAEHVRQKNGTRIHPHAEKVTGATPLGEVVFLLVDTMTEGDGSRKAIWDGALKYRPSIRLVVETRMGADNGRIYAFNPSKRQHVAGWEKTLYHDKEAEVSACGASVSVGATAKIIAGLAVWQMIRWFRVVEQGDDDLLDHEILISLRSMMTMTRRFEASTSVRRVATG